MILIGSQALKIGLEKIGLPLGRVPTDFDFLARPGERQLADLVGGANLTVVKVSQDKALLKSPHGNMIEIDYTRPGTSNVLYDQWAETMAKLDTAEFFGMQIEVAPLEMLYSLKKSHRHSPRMFEKHVKDYNALRVIFNGKDAFSKITATRYAEVAAREKLRTPSLNKSTVDFFDDKVSNRTFIHDQIHEVMAHGDRPMFEKIKIDPDKVACSKEKFYALHYRERAACVQEEAYVIALERAMIPMLFEGEKIANPLAAYKWAVMRICTTLCSGWFREWAVENYDNIILLYNKDYVEKFLKAVESGRIERIK
jgi:hypothetical protein